AVDFIVAADVGGGAGGVEIGTARRVIELAGDADDDLALLIGRLGIGVVVVDEGLVGERHVRRVVDAAQPGDIAVVGEDHVGVVGVGVRRRVGVGVADDGEAGAAEDQVVAGDLAVGAAVRTMGLVGGGEQAGGGVDEAVEVGVAADDVVLTLVAED